MWMAELARRADLSVATVKFYQREGLLHPGEPVSRTRTRYDDSHLRRLRLVRALVDVAGLRLDQVRVVLEAAADPTVSLHQALGAAHTRLPGVEDGPASEAARTRVAALLRRHGWDDAAGGPHPQRVAATLDRLDQLGLPVSEETLDAYADAMAAVARREVDVVAAASAGEQGRERAVHALVLGTLLVEPMLLSLRRIAHEEASAGR